MDNKELIELLTDLDCGVEHDPGLRLAEKVKQAIQSLQSEPENTSERQYYEEEDGCPTEGARLRREWRQMRDQLAQLQSAEPVSAEEARPEDAARLVLDVMPNGHVFIVGGDREPGDERADRPYTAVVRCPALSPIALRATHPSPVQQPEVTLQDALDWARKHKYHLHVNASKEYGVQVSKAGGMIQRPILTGSDDDMIATLESFNRRNAHPSPVQAQIPDKARMYAVQSVTGVHIGLWKDHKTAADAQAEHPESTILELALLSASEPPNTQIPDNELPGMWESADFMGGETDCQPASNTIVQGEWVKLEDLDRAFNEEILRVSGLEYNSNRICRTLFRRLRERLTTEG